MKTFFRHAGLILLFVLSAPYFLIPYYSFPEPKPFSGKQWINPYHSLDSHWQKSNFHLHAKAWGGTTDGSTTQHTIDSVYSAYGYNAVALSNYFSIDTLPSFTQDSLFIPAYEHGISVQKSHRIVIGARSVLWLDVLTPQTTHIKQFLFNQLLPTCDVLVMAHPSFGRPSYTTDDVELLQNYHCMEVCNHYRNSRVHWDSALSNGKLAWIVANDDSHNALSDKETGVCYTLIQTSSAHRDSICNSLKKGRAIGIEGKHGIVECFPTALTLTHEKYVARFSTVFDTCKLIGQGGKTLAVSVRSDTIAYDIKPTDTYIRAELRTPNTTVFLNPVVRMDKDPLLSSPEIDTTRTVFMYLAYCAFVFLYLRWARSQTKRTTTQ